MKIAAFDPGSKNFGVAILNPETLKIVSHWMNPYTVRTLGDGKSDQVNDYKKFLRTMRTKHGCTHVIAERFQARGSLSGISIEVVSFMLGLAEHQFPNKARFVIASQWKTAYNRNGLDLKALYKDLWQKPNRITPHQIDACLIGMWVCCKIRHVKLPGLKIIRQQIIDAAIKENKA
jgi:hypothetical protein